MADNDDVPFNRDFPLQPGVVEEVRPGVRRVLCDNPSPFTFTGTVSYIVGKGKVAIIDPGPDSEARRLTDAAQAMSGIVELIGNITGQINLLALNATIESARAGEAGRGFAVVASEVKNLANQAKQAADRIEQEIGNLNGISGDVVSALDAIKSAIQGVSEYVSSTAAAVEEQSTVTQEMSESMRKAAEEAASIGRAA